MARILLASILLTVLVACGSFPKNPELPAFDKKAGYRFDKLAMGDRNTDSLFVIVVLSGGGTRAASLSYGVMDALARTSIEWEGQQKTLLDEVDIISSVSGGSLTAGYYALNRQAIFTDGYEENVLKRNIQGDLEGLLFSPTSWFKLAGSSYGRSDLAAEFYDREIFDHKTYASIPQARPFVILNATDMTLGAQFPFIQDQFDLICSDLSGLPVARAFASSSAFPGLLTPLTYENYTNTCNFIDYPWVDRAIEDRKFHLRLERTIQAENRQTYYKGNPKRRDFIHLVDGGVSDNIGLRGPFFAISTTDPTYSILERINNQKIKKLVVIVANAAVFPESSRDQSAAVPGFFDTAFTAATVPLDNYSLDTIERLKAFIAEFNSGTQVWRQCNKLLENSCGSSMPVKEPAAVDLYLAEVAFAYIEDEKKRHYFEKIKTNFGLKPTQVDRLIKVGCELLYEDPEFIKLLAGHPGLTGTQVIRVGPLPNCE